MIKTRCQMQDASRRLKHGPILRVSIRIRDPCVQDEKTDKHIERGPFAIFGADWTQNIAQGMFDVLEVVADASYWVELGVDLVDECRPRASAPAVWTKVSRDRPDQSLAAGR